MIIVWIELNCLVVIIECGEGISRKEITVAHAHVQDVALWILEGCFTIDRQRLRVLLGLEQWLGFFERLAGDCGGPI